MTISSAETVEKNVGDQAAERQADGQTRLQHDEHAQAICNTELDVSVGERGGQDRDGCVESGDDAVQRDLAGGEFFSWVVLLLQAAKIGGIASDDDKKDGHTAPILLSLVLFKDRMVPNCLRPVFDRALCGLRLYCTGFSPVCQPRIFCPATNFAVRFRSSAR